MPTQQWIDEHDRKFTQSLLEFEAKCQHGVTVYRAGWEDIETGVCTGSAMGVIGSNGAWLQDPNGTHRAWFANFSGSN